jgi:electron transfer flavoprotein beta subunit
LDIIVCVKTIYDPETAAHYVVSGIGLQIEEQNAKIRLEGIETVISPFDAVAAEAAVRVKEQVGSDVTITVISMGNEDSIKSLRRVLAMGVDNAILLQDEAFEDANEFVTAHVLAAAIQKIGSFDLILCGRQAADVDAGVVGAGLAEILEVPGITVARDIQVQGNKAVVERTTPEEVEKIEVPLPALVTVGSELGEPRYPKIQKIIKAKRKKIPVWTARDLGLDLEQLALQSDRLKLKKISVVQMEGHCEFLEAASPDDIAAALIEKLRQEKVIAK